MYIQELRTFGLSEKEAKTYLALLELETATAGQVAKKSGVNRSSTYVIIENLIEKGFVGISENKGTTKYVASPPEMFSRMAKDKLKMAETELEKIKDIVPSLKALHKDTKKRPVVQIFEGVEGFKSAVERMLYSKEKKIRMISKSEFLVKNLYESLKEWYVIRKRNGVCVHAIFPDTKYSKKFFDAGPELNKTVYIPDLKHKIFSSDLAVYDDEIGYIFVSNQKLTTVFIKSKEIAEVMKGLFDMAILEAERIGRREGDLND